MLPPISRIGGRAGIAVSSVLFRVSLGLLHGTQPDVLVMCHEVGRDWMLDVEGYRLPSVSEAGELTLTLARRTNRQVRCAGVSLNTSTLDETQARTVLAEHSERLHLPVADPLRGGPELDRLVDARKAAP